MYTEEQISELIIKNDLARQIYLLGLEKGILEGLDKADQWREDLYQATVSTIVHGTDFGRVETLSRLCDGKQFQAAA